MVLQEILRIHPSGLTPRDVEKINSVWDQSDIRAFSIRLQTEPSLFQCPVLDEVHKKIWNTVGGEIGWQGIKVRDQVLKPRGSVATNNLHMQVSSKETKVTKQKKETKHKKQMINYNPALAAAKSKSKAKSEMMGPSKIMVQGLCKKDVAKVMAKSRPKKKPDNVAHVSGSSADDYYSESDGSEVDGLLQRPQIRRIQSQQVEGQNVHGPRIRLANNSVANLLVDGVVNGNGPRAPFVDRVGADRITAVTSVTNVDGP